MTTLLPALTADASQCCAPVTAGVLEIDDARRLARVFKALGDPTRVRLLSLIAARSGAEACVCDLTEPVGLSQPTVSHHMKQLVDAGLVTREQRGKWAYYAIVPTALAMLSRALDPQSPEDTGISSAC
ncbi:MAG TPA: metalloregulator ArsR/SmtB family transcription factor [Candidatus Agrococcus pullicola]|uniref:Metalloregulator ArsR/SmtB family transcription factor n=1 Tax=Candidatus Agrococcus pullicola TaxID=2838429 RepID=A0A9D1YWL3_9MICO|nr:metalloregulator ArsR/SmtB family transcription factor [Candidatus Agrococcus pullicola]